MRPFHTRPSLIWNYRRLKIKLIIAFDLFTSLHCTAKVSIIRVFDNESKYSYPRRHQTFSKGGQSFPGEG